MSGWNGSSVGYEPVRETELAVGQDQGGLVAVLPVEPGDDAVVEFVADFESLDCRRVWLDVGPALSVAGAGGSGELRDADGGGCAAPGRHL